MFYSHLVFFFLVLIFDEIVDTDVRCEAGFFSGVR